LPTFLLIPIPPSKCKSNPLYDDRLEKVAKEISQLDSVEYFPIIDTKNDSQASHQSQEHRNPSTFYQNMVVNRTLLTIYKPGNILVLLDDVLTSGAHFTAALRHLRENFIEPEVMGVFWAKSQQPSEFHIDHG
jgi:predicted amidophosphoribosyltransferase